MNNLATTEQSTQVSALNAFELKIQEHEKELDFVPDMDSEDSRKLSSDALKLARKTWKAIDTVRLEKKKDAEQLANAIHEQGKEALARLEVKYNPHKDALDKYKEEQKAIEEAVKQSFFDACQWLHDVANACQFASVDEISAFIAEVASKAQDDTGLAIDKNQRFEYGKIHLATTPKLEACLQQRIIADAEEDRQRQAAAELAQQQETLRQQQEQFEAQQQKERERIAGQEAKELAERAAKDQAVKAEAEAKQRIADAERQAKEAKERKEEAAKQAAIDAENNRIAEEQRLKQAQEQAAENERRRIQAEKEQAEREEAQRKANRTHKGKILTEAKNALLANGITEDVAKEVLKLIAAGKVPHASIRF